MLNILLVEDDELFRKALADVLREQNWIVEEATDGLAAKEYLEAGKSCDAIIADIQMPRMSGIDLLRWVKGNKPIAFILVTGFSHIMETQTAHELGADEFLAKPFEMDEMLQAIRRTCRQKLLEEAVAQHQDNEQYCRMNLDEFVSSSQLEFDVYIRLSHRCIKVGRKNDSIPLDRIINYRDKGLKYLYVRRSDFKDHLAKSIGITSGPAGDEASMEQKSALLTYTAESVVRNLFINDIDAESLNEAKDFVSLTLDALTSDPIMLSQILNMKSHFDHLYSHSVNVSLISCLIAKRMGWTSHSNLVKLGTAALFHDIGKKEIDKELFSKSLPLLSVAERQKLESHASVGRDLLMALPHVPSEVVAVAYEHHENNLGTGYPQGLKKLQIHPFTQIVRVANTFVDIAQKSPIHPGMEPLAAIVYMEKNNVELLSREPFNALCNLFREHTGPSSLSDPSQGSVAS